MCYLCNITLHIMAAPLKGAVKFSQGASILGKAGSFSPKCTTTVGVKGVDALEKNSTLVVFCVRFVLLFP